MKYKISSRNILGFMIIILGVIFLFDSLDIIDSYNIISKFWPLVLIGCGIFTLINNSSNRIFGAILILIGCFYQLRYLEIIPEDLSLWRIFWPLILIIVGIWFMLPKKI